MAGEDCHNTANGAVKDGGQLKLCLVANNTEILPEFHENLLQVCRECGFIAEVVQTAEDLMISLNQQASRLALLIVDLEMLNELGPEKCKQLKFWLTASGVPTIGLGFHGEEASKDCQEHGIPHYLLKFQQPHQILSMLRAHSFVSSNGDGVGRKPRYLVDLEASFSYQGENYVAEVTNLSLGGMFLKTFFVLPAGTTIEIELKLGDGHGVLKFPCEVRHGRKRSLGQKTTEAAGMGLMFKKLPAQVAEKLEQYLNQLLAIPVPEIQ